MKTTVQDRSSKKGVDCQLSTQRSTHNFIDYLSLCTPTVTLVLTVACLVKVRLLHYVRIQTVYRTQRTAKEA
jgi:hypothetical protein